MAIISIRLQHYRSYSDESFEFEPGVNIIVGPNASGKTNLLEAILVLSRGGSYRAKDDELPRFNDLWARVDGVFDGQTRVLKLSQENNKLTKSFLIDDKPFKRLNLEKTIPVVFFEPNHLQLITTGPEQRRDYIDDLLMRSVPGFKALMANYRRTLAQRNALLKYGSPSSQSQLFAWNIRLSELGGKIAEERRKIIDQINGVIGKSYSFIAGKKSKVEVIYGNHFSADRYASSMLSKLEKDSKVDLERGFTSCGPHREDILFHLGDKTIGEAASRGETRSLVLALKIFELQVIEQKRRQKPIFLLDDVFSELDGARRHALVDCLKSYQTIITTTDADVVVKHFTNNCKIIAVQKP